MTVIHSRRPLLILMRYILTAARRIHLLLRLSLVQLLNRMNNANITARLRNRPANVLLMITAIMRDLFTGRCPRPSKRLHNINSTLARAPLKIIRRLVYQLLTISNIGSGR